MKPHTCKTLLTVLILSTTLAVSTGCQTGPNTTGPMRAIWVTRYDYSTANEVTKIIDDCADAGFNAVLFQVRGNGTKYYENSLTNSGIRYQTADANPTKSARPIVPARCGRPPSEVNRP